MKTAYLLILAVVWVVMVNMTVAVQAEDYACTTNNGTIIITGYTGPGGDVTIPSTINGLPVTSISDHAFFGCTSVISVTIPASVTSMAVDAFFGCTSLTAINVDTNHPTICSLDGVLFNKGQNSLVLYPPGRAGDYAIPNSVTGIDWYAFSYCTSLTSVTIPNSVTGIYWYAFSYCTSLTSVTLGDSVTLIKDGAFSGCTRLTSFTIPNGVARIGVGVFSDCASLTSVTIPDSVTNILDAAFSGCTSLASVVIPNSLTGIGSRAFSNCPGLRGVYFQGNAPSCGADVFGEASKATLYYLPGTTGWGPVFAGRPAVLWLSPVILDGSVALQTNGLGFRVSWAPNTPVVVEAATDLGTPVWSPVSTNTLTEGWSDFRDPDWAKYPGRFYRVRSP